MLLYVDNILLVGINEKYLDELMLAFNNKFSINFLGNVHYFLGLEIYRTPSTLQLNQQKYVKDLLHKFGLKASKIFKTPMKSGIVLSKFENTTLCQ